MLRNGIYLVITPFFPSKDSHHGSYIYDQINEIRNQTNFNIIVLKTVGWFSNEKNYKYDNFKVLIFKLLDLPSFIFPGIFNYINKKSIISFLCKNKIDNITIVHGHVSYPSAFLLNYIVEHFGSKSILQHHGLDVLQLNVGRIDLLRKIQRNYIVKSFIKQLNNIDLNIGVSNSVLLQLRSFDNYQPKSEEVLYNGVNRLIFFPIKKNKSNIFKIGCIANFYKTKDQITLIKAVHNLIINGNEIKLSLIGLGPTLKTCKSYVKKNNLDKYITFSSFREHNKLNSFYNSIDLFVLPSYFEAFGCVYLESWSTNTPFIGISNQGISEIVPDSDLMLIDAQDIISLKEKILHFMNNEIFLEFDSRFDIKNTIKDFLMFDIFKIK